jgi:hypothetical protein
VQNFAARLVTNTRKFDLITPVLSELNWLPVNSTLNLKDAVMTFKCLKGLAPTYLSEKFKLNNERSYITVTLDVKIRYKLRFTIVPLANVVLYTEP